MAKTALVTGAGSGIGRATALAFAKAGYKVALCGRREEALKETDSAAGGGMLALIVCVTGYWLAWRRGGWRWPKKREPPPSTAD